jgi:DNA-binding transcriptional LysR family regulator
VVRQIHEGVSGSLRIGYISSTYHVHLVNVLKEIPAVFPFVRTKLYEVPTARQIKALEEGKLDIGILRTPVDSEKLKVVSLFQDPFVLVIPSTEQELSGNRALKDFLKDQHFIFFNKDYAPEYYRKLIEICQRLGFMPDVVHEANNVHSILRLVASGLGVSIVPKSLSQQYQYLNLSFVELPVMPVATEVVIAFKEQQANPAAN